jgi:hypothetical protein
MESPDKNTHIVRLILLEEVAENASFSDTLDCSQAQLDGRESPRFEEIAYARLLPHRKKLAKSKRRIMEGPKWR